MKYKVKAAALSALVAVLAVVYILTLVFDPENLNSGAFAWLSSDLAYMADGIEFVSPARSFSLRRKNNVWVLEGETGELPVTQNKVSDFFALLAARNLYPLRGTSMEARERLGLAEERASRIRVSGGAGLPLLDLFVGGEDVMGREVYLRLAGRNEIFSGENQFSVYSASDAGFWYDLRLFRPSGETGAARGEGGVAGGIAASSAIAAETWFPIESVQEAEVTPLAGEPYALRRGGGGWIQRGNESAALETTRVDAWLRSLVEAEGDDFAPGGIATGGSARGGSAAENSTAVGGNMVSEGSVVLRLGDGSSRRVEVGPADEENRRIARVLGSPFAYVLPEWNVNRLFRESSYFLKTP